MSLILSISIRLWFDYYPTYLSENNVDVTPDPYEYIKNLEFVLIKGLDKSVEIKHKYNDPV